MAMIALVKCVRYFLVYTPSGEDSLFIQLPKFIIIIVFDITLLLKIGSILRKFALFLLRLLCKCKRINPIEKCIFVK